MAKELETCGTDDACQWWLVRRPHVICYKLVLPAVVLPAASTMLSIKHRSGDCLSVCLSPIVLFIVNAWFDAASVRFGSSD